MNLHDFFYCCRCILCTINTKDNSWPCQARQMLIIERHAFAIDKFKAQDGCAQFAWQVCSHTHIWIVTRIFIHDPDHVGIAMTVSKSVYVCVSQSSANLLCCVRYVEHVFRDCLDALHCPDNEGIEDKWLWCSGRSHTSIRPNIVQNLNQMTINNNN